MQDPDGNRTAWVCDRRWAEIPGQEPERESLRVEVSLWSSAFTNTHDEVHLVSVFALPQGPGITYLLMQD